ncbi:hypothetical protein ACFFS4_04590 [Kutzneria kofuensis]|uniref:Uncharacterized protein n=1 Tax=Kutzneria kofuensis TaxID=103725 RepID=A0A7W9KLD9_9PSEU|nr:hypothetical protein [Kutzneria kofuensis]MBB5894408.1 hypothetical protein [Kutzneria kofuensis]
MLEFSAPESIRAEVEYRQSRAKELARPVEESLTWLPKLFRRHRDSDRPDSKATRLAA